MSCELASECILDYLTEVCCYFRRGRGGDILFQEANVYKEDEKRSTSKKLRAADSTKHPFYSFRQVPSE